MQKTQARLFQAGYEHGQNVAFISSTSSLRIIFLIPSGFKYASEEEEEEGDDDESSKTGGQEDDRVPLVDDGAQDQFGGGTGGTTMVDGIEDTANNDLAIHVD